MSSRTEEELVASAHQGDRAAIGSLLERHAPDLRRFLAGKIPKSKQAVLTEEDVLQVTYLDAFVAFKRFTYQGPNSFAGWLRSIAQHNLLDAVRSLEKEEHHAAVVRGPNRADGDDVYLDLFEQLGATSTTPSREARRSEARTRLQAAMAKLPEDYRLVVALRDLEELPLSQVAQRMQRTSGALCMLRARAHDQLRELLIGGSSILSTSQ